MAAISKTGVPSPSGFLPATDRFPSYEAGEDIGAADVVSMHTDGKIYKSTTSKNKRLGVAAAAASSGESVTPTIGMRFRYGAGLSKGIYVYLSGSVGGGLDTAGQAGDIPIGITVDATRIQFFTDIAVIQLPAS